MAARPGLFEELIHKVVRRGNQKFADENNVLIAEGPSQYLANNYYGPVELWPVFDYRGWMLSYTKANSIYRMPLEIRFTGVDVMLRILVQ
jgi:hypothetical protein